MTSSLLFFGLERREVAPDTGLAEPYRTMDLRLPETKPPLPAINRDRAAVIAVRCTRTRTSRPRDRPGILPAAAGTGWIR